MPATIQIPKDVFIRLRPAIDGTPVQGILFGQREECPDRRLIIHVKGFFSYESSSRDLVSTIAKLMNWKGQTVLGWFAAPGLDVLTHCDPPRIASAYFHTLQSAMLKVIVANYLKQHTEYDVKEITPLIARESCALFQDLVGLVVQRASKTVDSVNPAIIMNIESTSAQAFFSAPTLAEVLNHFQNLHRDVKGDIVEMNILKGLADVLPTEFSGLGINGVATSNDSVVLDERDDDDVGELFSVWNNSNNQGTSNKKSRIRRASTTDISDANSRRTLYGSPAMDFVEETTIRKRKGIDTENNKNASKKAKTPTVNMTASVIPTPFRIIPGQGSEYLHETLNEDGFQHSTEFDESMLTSFTTSFFAPTDDINLSTSSNPLVTYAQHRITTAYDAISHHLTTHTQGKISLYEKSCQEYELLLEILEALDGVGDEVALAKMLENWIEDVEDEDVIIEDPSLNANVGVVTGEVSSSSSVEEGEIEDEEEIVNHDGDVLKKNDEISSLSHNKTIILKNSEAGKNKLARESSPGWAWDDEEIGD
ncbi:17597_t:CDS:2 [Cetraspora pellucida]|uniref:17597_t:CDS:1 n=1 Tax=Cetraspora pellucida TaxID=1433469 RepID=A0ACA9MZ43_9GLOM|nr:17597_t:CDS:2 [Cetraspora pellucida]